MTVCTFFGHRECPEEIRSVLQNVLVDLIENQGVDMLYVGNQGTFDSLVRRGLRELKEKYNQIDYRVVLAYVPGKKNKSIDFSDTTIPEGIERIHPRYAISWRNEWMLKQSDYVVTYVTHDWGGAYQFARRAKRQGKYVINLSGQLISLPSLQSKSIP